MARKSEESPTPKLDLTKDGVAMTSAGPVRRSIEEHPDKPDPDTVANIEVIKPV